MHLHPPSTIPSPSLPNHTQHNPPGAVHWAESARQRDLGDRYLNSLAVDALFGAGHSERAEKTAMLFTRDGDQVRLFTCVRACVSSKA